jgi:hypothetical protein
MLLTKMLLLIVTKRRFELSLHHDVRVRILRLKIMGVKGSKERKVLSYSRTKWLSIIVCTAIIENELITFWSFLCFTF